MKAIIFDLDGVLIFTDQFHYQAWKTIADRYQIPFDEEVNNRLRGVSRMESLEIILSQTDRVFSAAEKESMAKAKNDIYRELLQSMTPQDVADDTRKTLERLGQMGVKRAIGSSSKNTPLILEKTHLAGYFEAVSDGNNITHSKPDPEVFLKAAAFLGLAPVDCLVVEDAEAGIDAAVNGGFAAAGLGCAKTYPKTTYPIEKLSDILKLV